MSAQVTLSGNYALWGQPRSSWNCWTETVEITAADAEGLTVSAAFAELELLREVSTDGRSNMAAGVPIGCIHLSEVSREPKLCQAVLSKEEYGGLATMEQQRAGDDTYEFTVCGTLASFERVSYQVNAAGPWDAYFLVTDQLTADGEEFFLAAVHPGFWDCWSENDSETPFADVSCHNAASMAQAAKEKYGIEV